MFRVRGGRHRPQDRQAGPAAPWAHRSPGHREAHQRLPRHQLRRNLSAGHRPQPGGLGRPGPPLRGGTPRRPGGYGFGLRRAGGPHRRRADRAGPGCRGRVPAGGRVPGGPQAPVRRQRCPAHLRRGDLRVRPDRRVVRCPDLRRHPGPDHVRQGRHLRLPPVVWCDPLAQRLRGVGGTGVPAANRLHLLGPPGILCCRHRKPGDHGEGGTRPACQPCRRAVPGGPEGPAGRWSHRVVAGNGRRLRSRAGSGLDPGSQRDPGQRGDRATHRHVPRHLPAAGHHRRRGGTGHRHEGSRPAEAPGSTRLQPVPRRTDWPQDLSASTTSRPRRTASFAPKP